MSAMHELLKAKLEKAVERRGGRIRSRQIEALVEVLAEALDEVLEVGFNIVGEPDHFVKRES